MASNIELVPDTDDMVGPIVMVETQVAEFHQALPWAGLSDLAPMARSTRLIIEMARSDDNSASDLIPCATAALLHIQSRIPAAAQVAATLTECKSNAAKSPAQNPRYTEYTLS